jgi:5S rRNA maturation endonuclease (ribonuclease M5)
MGRTANRWERVSRRRPCPVCGRPDWCVFAGPPDAPTAVICPRTQSPHRAGEAGFLHVLRDHGPTWAPWRRTISRAIKMMADAPDGKVDFAALAERYQEAVNPNALARLAESLGLTVESLRRLRVGWSVHHGGWAFPMSDAAGKVRGVRLRLSDGRKLAVRGSREALFIPGGLKGTGRVLVCEGATDTAALLDLGFQAVGRPSCTGGRPLLVEGVAKWKPLEVVIIADGDAPGQRGADRLATRLLPYVRGVKVIVPPQGVKDARAWLQAGATTADVTAAIDGAPVRRLRVTATKKGRCTDARRRETR